MLEGIRGEREERFHFGGDVDPVGEPRAVSCSPRFGGERYLHGVQQRQFKEVTEQAVVRVDPENDARQPANRDGCGGNV